VSEIKLDLPFPPSVNNLFSQTRAGRRFPSKKYVAWRKQADWHIISARLHKAKLTFPVLIRIELTPVDKRPRDGDNFTKGILDSLVRTGVLPDDNNQYVSDISVTWRPADKAASRATITITNADGRGAEALSLELTRPV
jgi:crossover junction endodeoxyribonuclease RusA